MFVRENVGFFVHCTLIFVMFSQNNQSSNTRKYERKYLQALSPNQFLVIELLNGTGIDSFSYY